MTQIRRIVCQINCLVWCHDSVTIFHTPVHHVSSCRNSAECRPIAKRKRTIEHFPSINKKLKIITFSNRISNELLFRFFTDSNTQSSDIYTLSTNSGSENSKTSSSDNLHTSPALRNPSSQSSSAKLSGGTPRHSTDRSNASHKCISEGSVSPQATSSYSGGPSADVYADNQTVINLGECQ